MAKVLKYGSLPDETLPRIKALVEQSAPNPLRPRLSEETERRLAPTESQTAAVYADMEETTHRLHKLAETIKGEIEELDEELDAIGHKKED